MRNRFHLVIAAFVMFTIAFVLNYVLDGSGMMQFFVVVIGIALATFFGQFAGFHFLDASLSEFLKGFKSLQGIPANIFVMGLGFPFALTAITGIFAVLRWPGPLFLYVFSVLTACISYIGLSYVARRGLLNEEVLATLKKHFIILGIVLVIMAIVMIVFRTHFPIDLDIKIGPGNSNRY